MIVPVPTDPEAQREIVKTAKNYCDAILLRPLREIGGILSEQLGHWKLMNQVRCLEKTKKYMEDKGVDPAKMLPHVFVPLMEEAGNTDDEKISDMFARLLAAHLDASEQDKVHPSFAKVLGQLAPLDAKILYLTDRTVRTARKQFGDTFVHNNAMPATEIQNLIIKAHGEGIRKGFDLSVENLARLGLITVTTTAFGKRTPGLRMAVFGIALVQVCGDEREHLAHRNVGGAD
jgi:hypothetical protein